jgi:hypothetical protein
MADPTPEQEAWNTLKIKKRLCLLYLAKEKATALGWTDVAASYQSDIDALEAQLPE